MGAVGRAGLHKVKMFFEPTWKNFIYHLDFWIFLENRNAFGIAAVQVKKFPPLTVYDIYQS